VPVVTAMFAAAGANLFAAIPDIETRSIGGTAPAGHQARDGRDADGRAPQTSVVDPNGRMHQVDNVYVADGSVFVTSGCQNPSNTLMAVARRTARGLTGRR
jgi:choline dehydrogenase-like flavoprotein